MSASYFTKLGTVNHFEAECVSCRKQVEETGGYVVIPYPKGHIAPVVCDDCVLNAHPLEDLLAEIKARLQAWPDAVPVTKPQTATVVSPQLVIAAYIASALTHGSRVGHAPGAGYLELTVLSLIDELRGKGYEIVRQP